MERLRDHPLRAQRLTAAHGLAVRPRILPSHASVTAAVAEAEQAEGWLARCDDHGRFVALSAPFVAALARVLRSLGEMPVLEVCAGDGALAASLRLHGVEVAATDAHPPAADVGAPVERLAAAEALRRHRPRVVLGSFVPVDAGVDQQVLAEPCVSHYLVLNARLGGECGSSSLWMHPGWVSAPLEEVTRWMICRHDVWLGADQPLVSRGEAWLLSRRGRVAPGIATTRKGPE